MYMIGIHLSLVKATWPRINQWQSLFSWAKVYEYNNVPCLRSPTYPQILLNYCFQFLLTITVIPREIEGNGYAKFLGGGEGGKQSTLWCVPKYESYVLFFAWTARAVYANLWYPYALAWKPCNEQRWRTIQTNLVPRSLVNKALSTRDLGTR